MAKSLNRVTLLGNCGEQPELKYTPQGTAVARLSIATNERFKDKSGEWKDRAEWHTVILWSRLGEIAVQYLTKGSKVLIEGRLQTRSWSKDGVTKYVTEIIAEELFLLSQKPSEAAKEPRDLEAIHKPGPGPITDEDIPF